MFICFRRILFRLIAFSILLICYFSSNAEANGSKKILVLHSYHQGFLWTDMIQDGLSRSLSSSYPKAELYIEYMNTKRNSAKSAFPLLFDLYKQFYQNTNFDAIVASDNNALDFLLLHRDILFPGVPVVFCGINDIFNYRFKPSSAYTGVSETADIDSTIRVGLKLHPQTRNIAVISDSTESGDINLGIVKDVLIKIPGVKMIDLSRLTSSQLIERLKKLGDDTIVFNTSFIRDADGRTFSARESMEFIANKSRRPVYTSWDFNMAPGAIGGKQLSGHLQGENAAWLVNKVLRGENAGEIPIIESPTAYIFDYQGLQKYHISESQLPAGSIITGKPVTFYSRYKYYIWFGAALFAAQVLIIGILSSNISKRKREEQSRLIAEAALRESETRYADMINNIQDTFYRTDTDGLLKVINPSGAALLGYESTDEMIGRPNSSFWMYQEKRAEMLEIMKRDGTVKDYEVVLQRRDGSPVTVATTSNYYYDKDGHVLGVEGIFRDITERKRSEDELFRQNNLISTIIESASEAIFAKDTAGVYISINKAGARMLGLSVADVVGRTDAEILPTEIADQFRKSDQQIVSEGVSSEREEIGLLDGRLRTFLSHKTPWLDNSGKIIGIIGVSNDITDRKVHEKEQLKMEKLESLGVLAGGIAHDFNNILTGILGNISFAQMFLDTTHKSYKPLSEAEKASLRAGELAHQLLTFAKGGEPVKKVVSIQHIASEAVSFVLHGSNVKGIVNIPDSIHAINADEGQMSQVFHNIIINAAQAMPGGGNLDITAKNKILPVNNAMNLPAGNYVSLSFTDQGCGIPESDLINVFDPYFTTKPAGNGLGLASVHSIISKHGGHIGVTSVAGVGTTFTIHLPSIGATYAAHRIESVKQANDNHQGGSILVMDDEEMILSLINGMLEHLGYKVTKCLNGSDAIEKYKAAKDSETPFSVVIMDLTIPGGMGGKEAAGHILEIDPQACLIVSSGYSNDPIISDYKSYGFSGAVAKPYTVNELGKLLGSLKS